MSFLYSRRRHYDNLRFQKGQRVLCLPIVRGGGGGNNASIDGNTSVVQDGCWTPAIIEAVNYQHYNKETMVTKVFPYKVKLLVAPAPAAAPAPSAFTHQQRRRLSILIERDTKDVCVELTLENFIRHDRLNCLGKYYESVFQPMLNKFLQKNNTDVVEQKVEQLFILAASLRRARILQLMVNIMEGDTERHPLLSSLLINEQLGRKLLYHAIHTREQYAFPLREHDELQVFHLQVVEHVENLEILMNWLRDHCNAPVEQFRDEHERHIEHIAVLRADKVLLRWLLWERFEFARVAPFRDAGRVGQTNIAIATEEEPTFQTGMPTDAYGWSPLHYLLFCYPPPGNDDSSNNDLDSGGVSQELHGICVDEKINLLMDYYQTIHYVSIDDWDMKTPEGFTALDLVRDKNLRARQLENFGLSLTTCRSKYGGPPSEQEMKQAVVQCREYQQSIYQKTVHDAMYGDTDPNYNYDRIERLVQEHGLDTQPRGWNGMPVEPQIFVFKAASLGFCRRFQWLFEVRQFATLQSVDCEGRNLMHVAAQFHQHLRDTQARMARSTNEHRVFRRAQRTVEKLQMIRSYQGETCHDNPESLLQRRQSHSIQLVLFDDVNFLLTGTKQERLEMVNLLHKYGMPLPTTLFCIHECDYPTAKLLLEKKIKYNSAIEGWFKDSAPIAMTLTKEYLYETGKNGREADGTLEDIALACLEKHPWDVEDLLEFSRLLLFQWLIEDIHVLDPVTYRLPKTGETLLHIAIRNKQVLVVFWLCVNYGSLCLVASGGGEKRQQLPAHLAIELTDDYEVSSLIVQAVVQHTGEHRHSAFLEGWGNDIAVWDLEDGEGKPLHRYAKECNNSIVRQAVKKKGLKLEFSLAIANLGHLNTSHNDDADTDGGDAADVVPQGETSAAPRGDDSDSEIDPDDL